MSSPHCLPRNLLAYSTVPQPPYSPDEAPVELLFPRSETPNEGHYFGTVDKIKEAYAKALKNIS